MTGRLLLVMVVACAVTYACGSGGGYGSNAYGSPPATPVSPAPQPVADQVVATSSLAFAPVSLNTKVGHTVTFVFESVGHNMYFNSAPGAPADIPGENANTSIARTFNTAGSFTYSCHIHPYMTGTVVVE